MGTDEKKCNVIVREKGEGVIEIEGDVREVSLLLVLSILYRMNLRILLFLYEKFGIDVFYIFYMFAGKEVRFPSESRLFRIVKKLDEVMEGRNKKEVDEEGGRLTEVVGKVLGGWRGNKIRVKVDKKTGRLIEIMIEDGEKLSFE